MRLRKAVKRILGRRKSGLVTELSIPAIHQSILRAIDKAAPKGVAGDYLDVGSGWGELLNLVTARYPVRGFACDYTDRLMKRPNQQVEIADLNLEPLPYEEARFSLITCAETIEHLEHYRETLREMYRVLKPGGVVVVTTPNVLNLRSRLHYFTYGFPALFGPLAIGQRDVHSPRGHINPVAWFYLAHALLEAGFTDLKLSVDRYQRRSLISCILLFLPIRLAAARARHREIKNIAPLMRKTTGWCA
jgi:SAM-dependent methyltransferase